MGLMNDPILNNVERVEEQNGDIEMDEPIANGHNHQLIQNELVLLLNHNMEDDPLLDFEVEEEDSGDDEIEIEFSDVGSDDLDPIDECMDRIVRQLVVTSEREIEDDLSDMRKDVEDSKRQLDESEALMNEVMLDLNRLREQINRETGIREELPSIDINIDPVPVQTIDLSDSDDEIKEIMEPKVSQKHEVKKPPLGPLVFNIPRKAPSIMPHEIKESTPFINRYTPSPTKMDPSSLSFPPIAPIIREKPTEGLTVYAMKEGNLLSPWKLAEVVEIKPKGKDFTYKVKFAGDHFKTMTGKQLAHEKESQVRLSVGTRCIAVYKEDDQEDFYPAVIAEKPKVANKDRYLVFYDDGYASYLEHSELRVVYKANSDVWIDIDPGTRDFVKLYMQQFPNRSMVKLTEGALIKTDLHGVWVKAEVTDVDNSLVEITFPDDGGCEWMYRGSVRFEPISKALEKVIQKMSKKKLPLGTATTVSMNPLQPLPYVDHVCNKSCLEKFPYNPLKHKLSNPLRIPIHLGWKRDVAVHKDPDAEGNWTVFYTSPCGRRLRNLEEIHAYLRMVHSNLEIDFFAFDCWLNVLNEFVPKPDFLQMKDISHGKERMPISASNSYDSSYPPYIEYSTVPIPQKEVYISNDHDFLVGCDCTDDCQNKGRCQCMQLTIQSTRCDAGGKPNVEAGYVNRRLQDVVLTGIYECNKTCSCSSTCLNRVVQFPIRARLQIFKTENRGWGIRALDDLPQGAFICTYVGKLYGPDEGNTQGTAFGDDYFADLDMIEVVEGRKDGYESDISDEGFDEDPDNKEVEIIEDPSIDDDPVFSLNDNNELEEVIPEKPKPIEIKPPKPKTPKKDKAEQPKHKSVRKYFGPNEDIYIMDAMTQGNIGRYLNHSCNPNVFVQNVFVNSHDLRFPSIAFFTMKFVPAGQELCWNYNYEVGTVENKQIICNCGAFNCKGRLL